MSARQHRRERDRSRDPRRESPRAAPPPVPGNFAQTLAAHWSWIVAAVVGLHVLLAWLALQPAPHTGGDNAGYLTLAQSLLERQQYRDLYIPSAPPHTQYPPGFPLILAAAIAAGFSTWVHFKLLIVVFSAVAVGFTVLWIGKRGQRGLALGVGAILAIAPGVIEQSHWVLSDVPFWAITMAALWAWQQLPDVWRGRFIAAVLLTTLAYFTRSAGLPLLLAAVVWLTLHKRWKQLAMFAAVIGPLAFLWWLRAKQQGGVDYVSQFWSLDPYNPALGRIGMADLFTRMFDNSGRYVSRHLPVLLFGVEGLLPLSILIFGLAIGGWFVRIRRLWEADVAEFFTPLYIGLILVWPAVWSGERFLLPALPFILFYAGDALVRLVRLASQNAAAPVAAAAAALLVVFGLPATAERVGAGRNCMALYRAGDRYACLPDGYKDYYRIAELAPRVLPDNAAVLSRKARSFYYIGGVPGQQYPLSAEPDSFFARAAEHGARYVVFDGLDGLSQNYLAPVLLGRSASFCILFGLGENRAIVFGIDPEAPPAASNAPGSFRECDAGYWRSPAVRDSLMRGLIPLQ